MSWSNSLLPALWRDLPFDIISTVDDRSRALARHAYPHVDGIEVESMGADGATIAVQAVFWGADYERRLTEFLRALDADGPGELVHPVFGAMTCEVMHRSVQHSAEAPDYASIAIQWVRVETAPAAPFTAAPPAASGAAAAAAPARTAAAAAAVTAVEATRAASPLAALNQLRATMRGAITRLRSETLGAVRAVTDVLSAPADWANDLSGLVDGVLDIQDAVASVSVNWQRAGNRLALLDLFSGGSDSGASGGAISARLPTSAEALTASLAPVLTPTAALAVGQVPTEVEAAAAVQATLRATAATGWVALAEEVFAAELTAPTLTPAEIERITATTRARCQDAITTAAAIYPPDAARAIGEPLRDAALAVQDAARAVLELRPPLIDRIVPAPCNLRLLAHIWYGDHARALELARLNAALRTPALLVTGQSLRAYAQ